MKWIATILLPIFCLAQSKDTLTWGPGEYNNLIINSNTHVLYQVANLPFLPSGLPSTIVSGAGGAHHAMCVDASGNLYGWGDNANGELGIGNTTNQTTWVQATVDSLGNPLTNVKKVYCGGTATGWTTMILKNDGTLWICWKTDQGIRGNGTFGGQTTRFVQIPFAGNPFIQDALVGFMGLALDNAGNVYTWGGDVSSFPPYILAQGTATPNALSPTKLTSISGVRMIAGSGSNYQFAVTATHIYGWAYYCSYIGVGAQSQPYNQPDLSTTALNPWLLDTAISMTGVDIDTIVCSSNGTYIIKTDRTLWFLGDNSNGGAGNGQQLDFRHYIASGNVWSPYNWDQGPGELMVRKPVQIAAGKSDFNRVFTSVSLAFYAIVSDTNGRYYGMGRNKGGVLCNSIGGIDSVAGDLQSARPNSWQVPWITELHPFRYPWQVLTTCPWFNDTTGAPLQSTYPVNTSGSAPTVSAGTNSTLHSKAFNLNAVSNYSSPARGIISRLWTNTSAPPNAIVTTPILTADTVSTSVTHLGVYQFQIQIQDNNFKTATSIVTDTVGCSNCCARIRSARHH